jgi:hypothetical protein
MSLSDAGHPNSFIYIPVSTKEMWDAEQERHPMTLSCCLMVETSKENGVVTYRDLMEVVMECRQHATLLHLKVVIFYHDSKREGGCI